jgi:hypothetical protein
MNMKMITKQKAKEIIADRKLGFSYKQLSEKHNVSKWWCIQHLKLVKPQKSWLEEKWKNAEKEAGEILKSKGFTHIINLNEICASPYWDYYAEKDDERWLFDVTINQNKNLIEKGLHAIKGYSSAVLLKDNNDWKIMKIIIKEI